MPKSTTILIAILALVTGILVYLAITSQSAKRAPTTQTSVPTEKPVEKTAQVFFNPQNVDLSSGSMTPVSTVDIMIDSGGQDITGVQAELQFDPKALVNVKLLPEASATGFFGSTVSVLFNDVNTQKGRISYATAIPLGGMPKKGVGKIATLNFQKAYGSSSSTQIFFLDKTLVTVLGANQSALKSTLPLNIVLSQTTNGFTPSIIP